MLEANKQMKNQFLKQKKYCMSDFTSNFFFVLLDFELILLHHLRFWKKN